MRRAGRGAGALLALLVLLAGCAPRSSDELAGRTLSWAAQIAPASEPGERMVLTGVLRDSRGHPYRHILVHLYHSDARGIYTAPGSNGPRLAAEAETGPAGELEIRSILPSSDNPVEPPHVHLELIRPGAVRQAAVLYLARTGPARGAPPDTLPVADSLGWRPRANVDPFAPAGTRIARDSSGVWRGRFDLTVP